MWPLLGQIFGIRRTTARGEGEGEDIWVCCSEMLGHVGKNSFRPLENSGLEVESLNPTSREYDFAFTIQFLIKTHIRFSTNGIEVDTHSIFNKRNRGRQVSMGRLIIKHPGYVRDKASEGFRSFPSSMLSHGPGGKSETSKK